MAVLLPVAAIALVSAPAVDVTTTVNALLPTVAAAAAIIAGVALLATVAAALEDGRLRDLADIAGLGMVASAFAVLALDAAGRLGFGIGLAGAAVAFGFGSLVRGTQVTTGGARVGGVVLAFMLVEVVLGAVLLTAPAIVDQRTAPFLLLAAATLLAIAAVAGLDDANRASAIGIAASSCLAGALGGVGSDATLVAAGGMALASLVIAGPQLVARLQRPRQPGPVEAPEPLLDLPPEAPAEPEFDEPARITRELRATLDDLVAARHLIELQRQEIDRATSTDSLTGLASRQPTLDRLRNEAAEARRYNHPLAIVLIDIDRFAALNHVYGLDVGDAVLRELALRLRVRVRRADAAGRIGADSFLVVLPHTDEGGAATFARAVLERVLGRRLVTDHGEVAATLSIGIALMRPGMTLDGDALLAAVEEALASARAAGGNRIAFDRLHGLARLEERDPGAWEDGGIAGRNA
ncbi:MAG: GGDEF domain-containing protein [Candidatus Limnocylindria bacterium]